MAAKTWNGAGVSAFWSTASAWGGTVPATTDSVTFNGTSVANCVIDSIATWSGGTITITVAYTGQITAEVTMTIAAFSQAGGTWTDQSTGAAFSMTSFTLSAGSFEATSGTLTITGNFTVSGSPTFTANSGTVKFNPNTGGSTTISSGSITFNLVTIFGTSSGGYTFDSTCTIPLGASPTLSQVSALTFNGTMTATGTITGASNVGTITFGAASTVSGGFTTWTVKNSITITSGSSGWTGIILSFALAISCTIDANGVAFGTCTWSGGGASTTLTIASGTTIPFGASPTIMANGQTCTCNGTISGTGTLTIQNSVTLLNITSTGTLSGFTALSTAGGVGAGLTINASATIPAGLNLTFTTTASTAITWALGGKTYGSFTRAGSGSAALTLSGSNTFTTFQDNAGSVAHTISFTAGTTQSAATWILAGASGKLLTLNSTVAGTSVTLHETTPGTQTCADYLSLQDITVDSSSTSPWYSGANSTIGSNVNNWITRACGLVLPTYQPTFPEGIHVGRGPVQFWRPHQNASLPHAYVMLAQGGTYTLAGDSGALLAARLMSATHGTYTLTGDSASLLAARLLQAAVGTYVLTGKSASLLATRKLFAALGTYLLTGKSSSLLKGSMIAAGKGTYTLNGDAAALLATRLIQAAKGLYALNGDAAALLAGRLLQAASGAYAINGDQASLQYDRIMNVLAGSYALTGDSVLLDKGYKMFAGIGIYLIGGDAATLVAPKKSGGNPPGVGILPGMFDELNRKKSEEEIVAQFLGMMGSEE